MSQNWIKPAAVLFLLGLLAWFSPVKPLDPWNLFSPKKICSMVFALALIQVLGAALFSLLGARVGAILSVSKALQKIFGNSGLLVLTFLITLFEIHGSVIANLQLHESGTIDVNFLVGLLAVSIFSSYLSKFFLVSTLGSAQLRKQVFRCTVGLAMSLLASWLLAIGIAPN